MSDGISNNGYTLKQFEQYYRNNADYIAQIRTFPVLFGAVRFGIVFHWNH